MACKCVGKVLTASRPHVLRGSSGPTPAPTLIGSKVTNAPLTTSPLFPCDFNFVEPMLMVWTDLV